MDGERMACRGVEVADGLRRLAGVALGRTTALRQRRAFIVRNPRPEIVVWSGAKGNDEV